MSEKDMNLRQQLVHIALSWQESFGVAPNITSAISEYDAAKIVGLSDQQYSVCMRERTAVSRGADFEWKGVRYQVKANRPSGKPGSRVTLVAKATNYEWDILVWILYNTKYEIEEAWEWNREDYIREFDSVKRLSPGHYRRGRALERSAVT